MGFGGDKCAVCSKTAYPMERYCVMVHGGDDRVCLDERVYHRACFKCMQCDKRLTTGISHVVDGKLYCPVHGIQMEKRMKTIGMAATEVPPADPRTLAEQRISVKNRKTAVEQFSQDGNGNRTTSTQDGNGTRTTYAQLHKQFLASRKDATAAEQKVKEIEEAIKVSKRELQEAERVLTMLSKPQSKALSTLAEDDDRGLPSPHMDRLLDQQKEVQRTIDYSPNDEQEASQVAHNNDERATSLRKQIDAVANELKQLGVVVNYAQNPESAVLEEENERLLEETSMLEVEEAELKAKNQQISDVINETRQEIETAEEVLLLQAEELEHAVEERNKLQTERDELEELILLIVEGGDDE